MDATTTSSISGALIAAALALIGKIVYDWVVLRQKRRGVAGAFAGEIGGYVSIIQEGRLADNLRCWVHIPAEKRPAVLRTLSPLPTGHPYYDKATDKLELLPPEQAQQITRFYNTVTSMRLVLTTFKSEDFIKLEAEQQNRWFTIWADMIEREFGTAEKALLPTLRRLAERHHPGLFFRRLANGVGKGRRLRSRM